MKILQVMAGSDFGGAETAFVDMCIAMHEAGEHVEVVTRPNPVRVPQLKAAGLRVYEMPFGGRLDVVTPWRIQKVIANFKPDIVQSWMSRAPSKVPQWKPSMKVPRYLHIARLGNYYKMKYFKTADCFTAITPLIATYIVEQSVDPQRVRHINNFADVEAAEHVIDRAALDTPDDAPLLLGLGRLHDDKAFDTLIQVVAEMPGVYAWIAGEGPQRRELEALIERLGVAGRVKLLGWRTDRAALLKAADICMFISRDEPFGTVFVQSWAQGTPVIVSDADGPRQFVRDGEDGLVAPIDNVEAIKACVQQILDDPQKAEMMVQKGRLRYENEFTKEASLQGYLQFYYDMREMLC